MAHGALFQIFARYLILLCMAAAAATAFLSAIAWLTIVSTMAIQAGLLARTWRLAANTFRGLNCQSIGLALGQNNACGKKDNCCQNCQRKNKIFSHIFFDLPAQAGN